MGNTMLRAASRVSSSMPCSGCVSPRGRSFNCWSSSATRSKRTTRNGWNLRNLVLLLALLGSMMLLSPAARAADEVSIGMVRLPTAIFIAIDQGFFAAEDLNITPEYSQNGAEIVPELATGKIDIGLASPGASLFNALALGVDAKIVADPC